VQPSDNTPPSITRTSSPSWGTFPSSGPTSDQIIQFTLTDPDSDQSWLLYYRFDAEAWRAGGPSPTPGQNSFTFAASSFTGSRLRAGSHTASITVTDSEGASSNVISVSYNVAAARNVIESRSGNDSRE
jgi:hypothetical protein